jgi:hypothetical protein
MISPCFTFKEHFCNFYLIRRLAEFQMKIIVIVGNSMYFLSIKVS